MSGQVISKTYDLSFSNTVGDVELHLQRIQTELLNISQLQQFATINISKTREACCHGKLGAAS